MVHRDVEESLDLVGVQVHRHDAVHARRTQQVGYQFRAYRNAGTVLAVLARPTEVGHHGDHTVCRSAVCGVDHQQQFHQVVCGREGRLHDKDGASADAFVKRGLEFAVAELQHGRVYQFAAEAFGYLLGEVAGLAAGKKFEFVNRHGGMNFAFSSAKVRFFYQKAG